MYNNIDVDKGIGIYGSMGADEQQKIVKNFYIRRFTRRRRRNQVFYDRARHLIRTVR